MEKKTKAALIYDFDGTLSPGNMQEYGFIAAVGKSNEEFWHESNVLAEDFDADPILSYMLKMLEHASKTNIPIKREDFQATGRNIKLYKGVESWFDRINRYGAERGIEILHYINSSGLKEIIEGTPIAGEFKKIYACEFLYNEDGDAYWPAVAINYTNKTQFIYKINKGVDSVSDSHLVNAFVPDSERPVPFEHMIYVGDGTTDIPCMRLVSDRRGHSIGVYNPESEQGYQKTKLLLEQNRVSMISPADYSEGSRMEKLVKTILDKIATDTTLAALAKEV
ncbi:MAG: haloacid dehalogenase-like hydrolase [Tidjanibacter sp.]|nr:haloacid dehalogenase-like hydrolase [Tidjanibacter sp.]MBQ5930871.1 haloacid dehalogenase-like hydrolase [Tidjanibacter sp.]